MSFAYMPMFTGDYLRDTRHLSMSEHGAYLLALFYCWDAKGPLPLDERKQFAIVGAHSGDEMEAWRRVREEFFIRMDDGWYNRRIQAEIERSESLSRARSEAGRKGFEARVKQLPSKSRASVRQKNLSPSPSPSLSLPLTSNPIGVDLAENPQGLHPENNNVNLSGIPRAKSPNEEIGEGEVVSTLPRFGGGVANVRRSAIDEWIEAYPGVLVSAQVEAARQWLLANPHRQKQNVRRFLVGWMSRAQERGR